MKTKILIGFMFLSGCLIFYSGITIKAPTDYDRETSESEVTEPVKTTIETGKQEEPKQITISFIGDCIIATADGVTNRPGSLNWVADREDPSYFFKKVGHILKEDDFTVANVENVFTNNDWPKRGKAEEIGFWFKTRADNARILKSGSVEIAGLANNHTNDYGEEGFKDTVAALESAGVITGYGGKPVIIEKDGIKIGIIFEGLWSYYQSTRIENQLKQIQDKADIRIVYFHGGTEKIHNPEDWKRQAARKIVDAGADLVVGSHPHVLQPMEVYNGVPIVYSLGNFVYGGNTQPENRTIIFQAVFDGDKLSRTEIIPCYVYTGPSNNWQPTIIEDKADRQKVLDFMSGSREKSY